MTTPPIRIERVVVTGGRDFNDAARIEADLRALLPLGLRRVAHGGARGADTIARDACWRIFGGDKVCDPTTGLLAEYKANWEKHGRAAGHIRNEEMLAQERPDLVLAYPDPQSRGTWDCVRKALKLGIGIAVWCSWWRNENVDIFGSLDSYYDDSPRWILKPPGGHDSGTIARALRGVL